VGRLLTMLRFWALQKYWYADNVEILGFTKAAQRLRGMLACLHACNVALLGTLSVYELPANPACCPHNPACANGPHH
jgi:hypothetical protein